MRGKSVGRGGEGGGGRWESEASPTHREKQWCAGNDLKREA